MNPFLFAFLVAFAVNGIFFIYAAAKKTDVVTDISYSLSFSLVAAALLVRYARSPSAALIPSWLTILWALRLGAYLFTRIIKTKVDHRFDGMRDKPLKFAKFWILQAVAVAVILLPVVASASSTAGNRGIGFWEALGMGLWIVAQ